MGIPKNSNGLPLGIDPGNAEYVDQLYEAFKESPERVSPEWRHYFFGFQHGVGLAAPSLRAPLQDTLTSIERLVMAYRLLGHVIADIDPLHIGKREIPHELTPEYYGLDEEALRHPLTVVAIDPINPRPAAEVIKILARVYCGTVTSEHFHIAASNQRRWIEQHLESTHGNWAGQHSDQVRKEILGDLTSAEGLERYLHQHYTGQKRFSLEGSETLIPLLDELVQGGGERGVTDMVVGMAHRGRLNVLVNLLGKAPQELFSEFEGGGDASQRLSSGDVKYHQGFYSDIQTPGGQVHLSLAFNPSHLEIVGPVVEGGCRARQDHYGSGASKRVLPVLVHGDAAFIGQGVVSETLNLSNLPAYSTGGTIHVVVNNQIGFTTSDPSEARSTLHCTDVAKLIQAPIFHVNGDDPDAVRFITQLALDYRLTFHTDVVIDLVCYRRHGHNEADEPMITQPKMYQQIRNRPTTRALYAQRLEEEGVINVGEADAMMHAYHSALDEGKVVVREFLKGSRSGYATNWDRFLSARPDEAVATAVEADRIQALGTKTLQLPEGFEVHAGIAKLFEKRRLMLSRETAYDWGMAETLAYASLLQEGFAIRLSGQDSKRGTFAHRHAVLQHQLQGTSYIPLANLFAEQPRFQVINSPLSELAALAFEYGYATSSPNTLVIWEAQFGDFGNCAQVVIDQFISSGYVKWGRLCALTLLLPHGFDGQGPEHSSARLERFLQLSAELNMRVWVPTTASQFFHLLRDQIKRDFRRPLVVMTPKSLLRHPLAQSDLTALSGGQLATVIPEMESLDVPSVRRVVLCSGKVFYDLVSKRRALAIEDIALVRVEQLYPFPRKALRNVLAQYVNATELVWCQEEPRNQGAWYQIQHHLRALKQAQQSLGYAGRPSSASPACGYYALHRQQQDQLVATALSEHRVDDPGERLDDIDSHFESL